MNKKKKNKKGTEPTIGDKPSEGMSLETAEKEIECDAGDGNKEKLMVPNRETLLKYKPGDTTFKVCGWCKFSGTGQEMKIPNTDHRCMIVGKCILIPLTINSKSLLPPVKLNIKSRKKLLAEYRKLNSIERRNIKQFKQNLGIIKDMMKTIERTGSEDIENIDIVKWNTECLFVRALNNKEFRDDVLKRNRIWLDEFTQRVNDRKRYIRSIRGKKSKNEKQ